MHGNAPNATQDHKAQEWKSLGEYGFRVDSCSCEEKIFSLRQIGNQPKDVLLKPCQSWSVYLLWLLPGTQVFKPSTLGFTLVR